MNIKTRPSPAVNSPTACVRQNVAACPILTGNFVQSSASAAALTQDSTPPRLLAFVARSRTKTLLLENPYSGSVRVPVTASNRQHLRDLRQMELKAWTEAAGVDGEDTKALRTAVAEVSNEPRREFWLYALLAFLAAVPISYTLFQSWQFFENLPALFRFIGRLLT